MANAQSVDQIISLAGLESVIEVTKLLEKADKEVKNLILSTSELAKSFKSIGSIKDLYASTEKAQIIVEKLRKAEIEAAIVAEKLNQIRAKGAADMEKQTQKELDLQAKRTEAEDRRAKKAVKSSDDVQAAREKERLAELKLDSDRKKAFDNYEAKLKRKAEADARSQNQLERGNALIAESSRAYRKLSTDLESARKKAQDIGVAFGVNSNEFRAAATQVNELDARIRAVDTSLGLNQRNVGNYSSALGGLISNLKNLALGYLSFQGAQALVSSAFDTALKTDSIKTSLEFTFGSIDVAKQKMDSLRATADRLGLEYTSLADAYKSFAGAAVASNFPLKETDRIFNAVANAGAKLKLSSDQVGGALNALQQMISKGTVQSEELRGQLGERLPGAFSIAARAMGVTTQELGKLLKDGKVLAADLLPKLADELDKTFGNDKTEKISALGASVNRLKNNFSEIVETKGALSALFTVVVDGAGYATKGIATLSKALGVYYDLLTHPKKFLQDSANDVRSQAQIDLEEKAAAAAKNIVKTTPGKSALFQRVNEEIEVMKERDKVYQKTKNAYYNVPQKDRSLTLTYDLDAKEDAIREQIALVAQLRLEFQKLYGIKPPKPVADGDLTSVKAIQARIAELKKLEGSAIEGNAIFLRIQALQERLKKAKPGTDTTAKEQLQLDKSKIVGAQEAAERLMESESSSFELRLSSAAIFYEKSKELIENDRKTQLQEANLTAIQIETINQDAANKQAKLKADAANKRDALIKTQLTKEGQDRVIANQNELNEIKKEEAFKLGLAQTAFKNGTISEKQLGELTLQIQSEYNLKYLNKELEQAEKLLAVSKLTGKQRADAEKELAELRVKIAKGGSDTIVDGAKGSSNKVVKIDSDLLAKKQEELEQKKEIARELFDFTSGLVSASFINEQNAIQAEMDANEKKTAAEIENVNNSVGTEEEKANRIAIINARAQSQQDLLDQKIRDSKTRQAKADKAAAVAQAIMNGALAMTKVAAQTGVASFVFSPLIAALTAVQVATILAQPIPKYFKGTDSSKAGLALTDELGPEGYITPSGQAFIGDNKPNLKNLQAGTKIIPHHELVQMIARPELNIEAKHSFDMSPLTKVIQEGNKELIKAYSKAPKQPAPLISKRGMFIAQQKFEEMNRYLNRNLR